MLDHFVDGSKRKRNRLTIALEDEPGKMFGILKVREIEMKIATYDKNLFKTFIKTFYFFYPYPHSNSRLTYLVHACRALWTEPLGLNN
jgi:hypothetical protein